MYWAGSRTSRSHSSPFGEAGQRSAFATFLLAGAACMLLTVRSTDDVTAILVAAYSLECFWNFPLLELVWLFWIGCQEWSTGAFRVLPVPCYT
jgi:hypothetical protein